MNPFTPTRADVMALIAAAIAAPSADNCHHVRFDIQPTGLALRTDDFYATCAESHRRALTELSFGGIAENMRVWLAARGRVFRPVWFPASDDPRVLFDIQWAELVEALPTTTLAPFIVTRHTNRKFFDGPAVTPVERRAIDACLPEPTTTRLDWFDDPERRSALLRLMRKAESSRFRHRPHHAELFESIDFARGWSTPTAEHLAPGSLEVEIPARAMFQALRHWPVMRLANRLGMATLLGWRVGDLPARRSPHLLVVASRLPQAMAALEAGALFERVWLTTESLGLALQPMAASAVLSHDAASDPDHVLEDGWSELLDSDWRAVMVFRIGRAPKPSVRSLRQPVASYLVPGPAA